MSKLTLPGGGAARADLAARRSRLSAAQRELLARRLAPGTAAAAAAAAAAAPARPEAGGRLEPRESRGAFAPGAPAAPRAPETAAAMLRPRPAELVGGAEPLSFAQHRLWRLARVAPRGTAYNVFHGVRLRGRLQVRTLAAALGRLVTRHEALRTRFPETEQGPVAVVDPAPGAPRTLPLVDLAALAAPRVRPACERVLADQAGRPFDLARGPLLRAALIRTAENEHMLLLAVHHIVIDGWSLTVLVRDLFGLYAVMTGGGDGGDRDDRDDRNDRNDRNDRDDRGSENAGAGVGTATAPRPPALQAGDFARWQRELLRSGELDGELAWWRRQLADAAPGGMRWPAPDLGPRQAIGGGDGDHRSQRDHRSQLGHPDHRRQGGRDATFLDAGASAALKALARRERATLFVVVLAAWKAVLHRQSGEDDVLVGTVVALRDRPETAQLVGFLLNLLVLRTRLGGDPPFVELLARVRETALEALTHQRVPFEYLAAELAGAGAADLPTPWIRGLFIMPTGETAHAAPLRLPALEVEPTLTGEMGTEFEWTLYARESDGGIRFDLGYSPGVFLSGQAEALLGELTALLERAAADPGLRLSQLAPAITADGGEPGAGGESGAAGDRATAGAGL
jgi:Condensation domain